MSQGSYKLLKHKAIKMYRGREGTLEPIIDSKHWTKFNGQNPTALTAEAIRQCPWAGSSLYQYNRRCCPPKWIEGCVGTIGWKIVHAMEWEAVCPWIVCRKCDLGRSNNQASVENRRLIIQCISSEFTDRHSSCDCTVLTVEEQCMNTISDLFYVS
jgi:hypothetical protein